MSRKVPTYRELKKFLTVVLKFKHKRTKGSHETYEGYTDDIRTIVTLDRGHDNCPSTTQKKNMQSMIKQMGLSKKEFEKKFYDMLG